MVKKQESGKTACVHCGRGQAKLTRHGDWGDRASKKGVFKEERVVSCGFRSWDWRSQQIRPQERDPDHKPSYMMDWDRDLLKRAQLPPWSWNSVNTNTRFKQWLLVSSYAVGWSISCLHLNQLDNTEDRDKYIHLPVHPTIHLPTHPSFHLSSQPDSQTVGQSAIYLSIHPSIYPYNHPPIQAWTDVNPSYSDL